MFKKQSKDQNPISTNGKHSPSMFSHILTLAPFVPSNKIIFQGNFFLVFL